MSRLDELPPDQRAALSLILRQRKSFGEVATLLGIPERAVHDRAHAALAVLAPRHARGLTDAQRADVGDYLLGQQPGVAERLRTRTLLGSSEPARAWAQAIAAELAPLADGALPAIPPATGAGVSDADAPPDAPPATSSAAGVSPPSSRLGGALLLAALVVAVVVAVILITSSGGGSSAKTNSAKKSATAASKAGPTVSATLALRSPSPGSNTVGVVAVLSEKGKHAFYIEAQHLPATHNFYYAIWLYNSPTSARALSKGPPVGATHKLAGGSALPTNAGEYHEILLTRETNSHPTQPGTVVLRGAFNLGG
ncbi:MAG TPA: sigma-70 region 4 domain-containing protein [Solirubrobacteraceae bacterium]|nr:sigma-70 region 4 domain-containing protein [Solirubrobacteraceae bacterium]